MFTKTNIIIGVLLLGVLVLLYIVIYRKPEPVVELFDATPYEDSIKTSTQNAAYWEDYAHQLEEEKDALSAQKQTIRYVYETQYIYARTANLDQLDSIVRANAGLPAGL